jgi:hypothetical protein
VQIAIDAVLIGEKLDAKHVQNALQDFDNTYPDKLWILIMSTASWPSGHNRCAASSLMLHVRLNERERVQRPGV